MKTTLILCGNVIKLWITMWKLGISQKVLYTRVIFENSKFDKNYQKTQKRTQMVNEFMLISQKGKS